MIDGCNKGKAMWHVVIPLMRSSFVQCIFLSTTRCFMVYDLTFRLPRANRSNQSVLAAMHVYNQAFVYKNIWHRSGGGGVPVPCSGPHQRPAGISR